MLILGMVYGIGLPTLDIFLSMLDDSGDKWVGIGCIPGTHQEKEFEDLDEGNICKEKHNIQWLKETKQLWFSRVKKTKNCGFILDFP